MHQSCAVRSLFVIVLLAATVALTPAAYADLSDVNIYANQTFYQTSQNPPTTPDHYWFTIGADMKNTGDFDGGSAQFPGSLSPVTLTQNGTSLIYYSANYSSLSAMQADYPFGDYSITATNSITHVQQTGVLTYSQNLFSNDIAAFTPSTWNLLQGLNPNVANTLMFNAFTPNPGATKGYSFVTIYDQLGPVWSMGFLDPSTTSVVLPAGTLNPNEHYSFELDFSDRLDGFDQQNQVFTEQGFDKRTDGEFMTGTPEPGTISLLGLGFAGVAALRRKLGL
jgi:hypothetical protein